MNWTRKKLRNLITECFVEALKKFAPFSPSLHIEVIQEKPTDKDNPITLKIDNCTVIGGLEINEARKVFFLDVKEEKR